MPYSVRSSLDRTLELLLRTLLPGDVRNDPTGFLSSSRSQPSRPLGGEVRATEEAGWKRWEFEKPEYSGVAEEPGGKSQGKRDVSGPLSMGRQAQIMPVLASMVVQMVEFRVP